MEWGAWQPWTMTSVPQEWSYVQIEFTGSVRVYYGSMFNRNDFTLEGFFDYSTTTESIEGTLPMRYRVRKLKAMQIFDEIMKQVEEEW